MRPELVLASASSRRIRLLRLLGVPFSSVSPSVLETDVGSPEEVVRSNAARKALSAAVTGLPVLGADTVLSLDGKVLGKPGSPSEAERMLLSLSGRSHAVLTGWVILRDGVTVCEGVERSVVTFSDIRFLVPEYVRTGEWEGKAGGYAIQGGAAALVESLEGSYSNVVGLPLEALAKGLAAMGMSPDTSRIPAFSKRVQQRI